MTNKEIIEFYKKWIKNAAGGAYNTTAMLAGLPIQAASVLSQVPGLFSEEGWKKGITVPDPFKEGRKAFGEMTGLPTEQADKGFETAWGFGSGAVPGPTLPAAVIGGAASAVAENIDNPLLKTAVSMSPAAIPSAGRVGSAIRKGSLRSFPEAPETTVPMSRGRATGKASLLAEEDYLSRHSKSADKVATMKQGFAKGQKDVLKQFLDAAVKAGDEEAGTRAAIGWKKFEEAQKLKHKQLSEIEYGRAFKMSGGGKVNIDNVLDTMEKLYAEKTGIFSGDIDKGISEDLKQRLKNLSQVRGRGIDLEDVQSQLEYFGKMTEVPKGTVAPGTDVGVAKQVFSAFKEALDKAALQNNQTGQAAKQLIKARAGSAERINDLQLLSDTPLGVFFEQGKTGERILLQPSAVMEKLRKLPKEQRDMYVSVLEMSDPGAVDALRKNMLDDLIKQGNVKGGSIRDVEWSSGKFLSSLYSKKDDIAFLIPNPEQRKHFYQVVEDLQRSAQNASIITPNGGIGMREAAQGVAMGATKTTGAGAMTRGAIDFLADLVTDKNAMADYLFGTKAQPKTITGRLFNTLREGAKQTPVMVNREAQAGAMLGRAAAEEPAQTQPTEQPQEEQIPDFILKMLTDEEEPEQASPVSDDLLDRIKQQESGGDPFAVSPKGALGLYQFMPETAKELGIDPFNPDEARTGAKRYLETLMKKYGGDTRKALAAYNWGMGNLDRYGLEKAPPETLDYLNKLGY